MLLKTIKWETTVGGVDAWIHSRIEIRCSHYGDNYELLGMSTQSRAQTTGAVHIKIAKVGFIVGIGGAGGTLTYHGRRYRLSVGGVNSVGTIGVAEAKMVGTAYHLHNAADIAGTYAAKSASVAVVGGRKVATLQNEKGVVLKVHGVEIGVEASLSLSGMTLALQ
jgi:hypothetical protein